MGIPQRSQAQAAIHVRTAKDLAGSKASQLATLYAGG
jgi:hypothetical protein